MNTLMTPINAVMPRALVFNAYLQEARSELLRYLRNPGFLLPVILFPTAFYLMFGVVLAHAEAPLQRKLRLTRELANTRP